MVQIPGVAAGAIGGNPRRAPAQDLGEKVKLCNSPLHVSYFIVLSPRPAICNLVTMPCTIPFAPFTPFPPFPPFTPFTPFAPFAPFTPFTPFTAFTPAKAGNAGKGGKGPRVYVLLKGGRVGWGAKGC
jgi:hypothetical protein